MSDLIDRQELRKAMYHEAMEKDSDWQRWDSGCWIRYKMFERVVDSMPSAQQWHVIKKRPMTNDERIEWSGRIGYDIEYEDAFIYSNLPDDGEEVIVSSQYGNVYVDKFCQDEGCYFEENGDMDGIVAWMPLPEPYKAERREE